MVRVAVVGCAHGMLEDIFATVRFINEMDASNPIQLLVCCGDFECMRNTADLQSLACPPKYREMHSFHEYYSQLKTAPVLTVFVGGNHEASNYLQELHYGGWVAPRIFYLGVAGVINVAGLRIAGLSGIYKQQDYTSGRFERPPYDNSTMRSIYHVREFEVYQMSHLQSQDPSSKVNVFLSHDWPRGIEQYGDVATLVRRKPFFQQEIQSNTLGSPAGELLLHTLRPAYWFAAHLHVKFAALVRHAPNVSEPAATATTNETPAPMETEGAAAVADADKEAATKALEPVQQEEVTRFLALDKCLPRREFFQVLDIPTNSADSDAHVDEHGVPKVMFDVEWLAVLRATHHLASTSRYAPRVPQEEMRIDASDLAWVQNRLAEFKQEKNLTAKAVGEWVGDFAKTAPSFHEEAQAEPGAYMSGNPQTDMLLELLKLPHVLTALFSGRDTEPVVDPNEIDLDEEDDEVQEDNAQEDKADESKPVESRAQAEDPCELDIDS